MHRPRRRFYAHVEELRCYACRETKPLSEFSRDASKRSGYKSLCKTCDREKARAYYAKRAG